MKICFTGHRNKQASDSELKQIWEKYPNATWVHGGAKGFDSQVEMFAQQFSIPTIVFLPNYKMFGRGAPIVRNKQMVNDCSVVVACWDKRASGGTYQTVCYAKTKGLPVLVVDAI